MKSNVINFINLALQADRKRTKFQNNLDDMLFGGGPRRKTAEKKPAENLNKSIDNNKSTEKAPTNTAIGTNSQTVTNNQIQPNNSVVGNNQTQTSKTVI